METADSAVTITDGAAGKIRDLVAGNEEAADQALRVAVKGGGCSGFQYALALDKPKEDDHVFEHNGVSVVVDKVSLQFVFGSQVDYVDGLTGAGFTVNNPNVVAACGCGSSFQVKEDAPEHAAV
ncbi:iron-sulfur cluster insertion protein ErpA [soil metagenome]